MYLKKEMFRRYISLGIIVKAMLFPVVTYKCESWTIKKAEHWRIDPFELWCGLLRVPWTARRSNQSVLKEINAEYSLEGLILKLQVFGHLCEKPTHGKRPSCWERLKAEGEERNRGWDGWMTSLIQWTWTWANSGRWWRTGKPGVPQSIGLRRVRNNFGRWTTKIKKWKLSTELHWPVKALWCHFPPTASVQFSSVVQSCLTLRSHGLQHARPPCPSPTPGVHSDSRPSSQWCYPAISSSVTPFSSHLKSFPASGSFQMSQFFTSDGQVLEFQLQHQFFQWILGTDFL